MGFDADAETTPGAPYYRVRPQLKNPLPSVSLIIPTRDEAQVLERCLESIRDKTNYANYEIVVVDNQSSEAATADLFKRLEHEGGVRRLSYDAPFNYAAINNMAVASSCSDIAVLLNNDTTVIDNDWLTELVRWSSQPDIGCVGAKLLYPNETVQHAGVVLGIGGVAGHAHKHAPRQANGYFSRLKVIHNVSAVTGACLAVRRQVFEDVGGLDAENLAVAFNDIDFCLRVRDQGLRNVFTPYARLYHHESLSRGSDATPEKKARFAAEALYMQERWGRALLDDPFYSPHLTLLSEDFSLRRRNET